jgi:hypothetical protein
MHLGIPTGNLTVRDRRPPFCRRVHFRIDALGVGVFGNKPDLQVSCAPVAASSLIEEFRGARIARDCPPVLLKDTLAADRIEIVGMHNTRKVLPKQFAWRVVQVPATAGTFAWAPFRYQSGWSLDPADSVRAAAKNGPIETPGKRRVGFQEAAHPGAL